MAEGSVDAPSWIMKLENKQKWQHRLAHEIGAGSPCLKCVDSCPGLDLHFWRKSCRNCHCRKEDHEIVDEDNGFLQFDILLSSGDKAHKRVFKQIVLDLNVATPGSKSIDRKIPLHTDKVKMKSVFMDWVPPDVSLELAAEYMQRLPVVKIPITGTSGALHRKQQFEKQLPPHDLSASLCHNLSSNEVDEFNKYLTKIKMYVVGQGRVEKLAIPQSQIAQATSQELQKPYLSSSLKSVNTTMPNASNYEIKPFKEQQLSTIEPSLSCKFNLENPSNFVVNNLQEKLSTNKNQLNFNNNFDSKTDSEPVRLGTGHNLNNEKDILISNCQQSCEAITEKLTTKNNVVQSSKVLMPHTTESIAQKNKPPISSSLYSSHVLDNNKPSSNPIYGSNLEQLKLDDLQITTDPKQNLFIEHSDLVSLQKPSFSERLKYKVTQINSNTTLADNRINLENSEKKPGNYNKGSKFHCQQCSCEIMFGEVVVSVDKGERTVYWHPQCFVCTCCQELLVDLVYFFYKNKVYCGRHYAEIVNIPRCFACDELIFVKQYTVAENKNFHVRHFCCLECDNPLAGKEYIPINNHPICIECFNKSHAKVCQTCHNIITPTQQRVSLKDMHWHASETCFHCTFCKRNLLQSKMVIDGTKPFCNRNCVLSLQ